jgi:hypothetical protein
MPDFPKIIIGRKRRARRARGRWIEIRRNAAAQGLHAYPYVSAFYVVPTEQDARAFFDPSLGEPWEEQADD